MLHVKRTFFKTEFLTWSYVPGYTVIGRALIEEMQNREIRLYSDSLIDATKAFLANNKLLMAFVRVTFLKTSTSDLPTVMKTMDLTAKWFLEIHASENIIPPNFDFAFFRHGIEKIIKLNHGAATAKVFWLMYQVWHVIPTEQKDLLLKDFLKPDKFY